MQCYFSCKPCLTFILPNFLNECKPLSDVSYGYCWKCSAVNYQMWCTGKICQEVIQKWLQSTLASQMQKNKATKRAFLIVLNSLVLRCIWSICLIKVDSLQLALLPSVSRLLEEEKVKASHPFLLIPLLQSSLLKKMMATMRKIGVFLILNDEDESIFLCWTSLSSAHILYHTECVLSQECEEDWMPWERDFTVL